MLAGKACKKLSRLSAQFADYRKHKVGFVKNARKNPPLYAEMRSWLAFDDSIRNALHGIKYHKDHGMGEQLAFEILPFVRKLNWDIDIALPVPLGKQRYKERGIIRYLHLLALCL
jgi:predicted amidophosphoribosyltransferase